MSINHIRSAPGVTDSPCAVRGSVDAKFDVVACACRKPRLNETSKFALNRDVVVHVDSETLEASLAEAVHFRNQGDEGSSVCNA